MNLHAHARLGNEGVSGRLRGIKIAVALFATAALCLGPVAAASADDAVDAAVAAETTTQTAVEEPQPPAVEDPAVVEEDPAPVEEVAVEPVAEDPAPDPAPSPADPSVDATDPGLDASASDEESSDGTDEASVDDTGEEAAAEEDPVADTPAADEGNSDIGASLLATEQKPGDNENGHQGIGICHATSSDSNPYVLITVDVDSIFKQNGHDEHTKAGGTRSDVIPAFWYVKNGNKHEYSYPGTGSYYPGKNLDATGIYMLANDCNEPPVPEQPTIIAITPLDCLVAEEGASVLLRAALGNLTDGEDYTVTVTLAGQPVGEPDEFTADGSAEQWSRAVTSTGTYTITVMGPGGLSASTQETVKACDVPPEPPQIEVIPGSCIVPGEWPEDEVVLALAPSESEAEIFGSDLEPGEHYWVTVTMGGDEVFADMFTADEDGNLYVPVVLYQVGTYVATISGPGESGLSASEEFEVAECPPPAVPEVTVTVAPCTDNDPALPLQAIVWAIGLEPGESYPVSVSGPSGFNWMGSLTGSEDGTAQVTVSLGADGNYAVSLEGAESVEFTAAKACAPTVPASGPVPPSRSALPNTGAGDAGPLLWAGTIAMILAAGLMLEPVLRRRARR